MIYIMQLIYIKEGQEEIFHQFEDIVLPLIPNYNGKLLLRVRPGEGAYIECGIEKPYEIHLVSFAADEDILNYNNDATRKKFLHLKEQSIKAAMLVKGNAF
ncbi:MAG TPA: hypothetical protein VG738_22445 [Chitinophagaceae bacterium]|nr:hypothetical protein [Chitinophagaceae bacterium]